jgi:hypothetical protein
MFAEEKTIQAISATSSRPKTADVVKKGKGFEFIFRPLRQAGFLLVSLILRWPVWGILRIARVFDYIFLVYPGSASDLDGYCPRKIARSWLFSGKPTVGGIISAGKIGVRGIYFVVPNTAKEFFENNAVCQEVKKRLEWIKNLLGKRAKAVAIAGQVPSAFVKNGDPLEEPFVRGNKGTVFCVMETLHEAMKKQGLEVGKAKIAIIGIGYVGGLLFDALKAEGQDVIGVDIEFRKSGVALKEDGEVLISIADVVIALTPKGSDFLPYVKRLKKDAIIIDDTHPKIKMEDQPEGMIFYKVAVGLEGVKFLPQLPGYRADWIPGCAVEAILTARTGEFNGVSQKEFNHRARSFGFFAHLVK